MWQALADVDVEETGDGLRLQERVAGTVHHLNATAAIIYLCCDGCHSDDAIAERLAQCFRLSAPPSEEVSEAIAQLEQRGLIARCG
ncbi:Coenzyme PQQ synthesis protein D (PqqD) [Salinihabitans flavidus]|uniref:Coenzyme PQQ synthesis protein D (PqqD) n=1 Tax=Salinihabitans flavidus TaxID=569882 RepID=A0A1H8RRS4_9RHOB|nr:PqqD family protein [Salinihabitans flavidus]SEO69070.1 Coenzyme PQQ synthesis protein D (PqqD) [Salinihabitans flavidus]